MPYFDWVGQERTTEGVWALCEQCRLLLLLMLLLPSLFSLNSSVVAV